MLKPTSEAPKGSRPSFHRQRSQSQPTLRSMDESEAAILFSTAKRAAARRRHRPRSLLDWQGKSESEPDPVHDDDDEALDDYYYGPSGDAVHDDTDTETILSCSTHSTHSAHSAHSSPLSSPAHSDRPCSLKSYAADMSSFVRGQLMTLSPTLPCSPQMHSLEPLAVAHHEPQKPQEAHAQATTSSIPERRPEPVPAQEHGPPSARPQLLRSAFSNWSTTTNNDDVDDADDVDNEDGASDYPGELIDDAFEDETPLPRPRNPAAIDAIDQHGSPTPPIPERSLRRHSTPVPITRPAPSSYLSARGAGAWTHLQPGGSTDVSPGFTPSPVYSIGCTRTLSITKARPRPIQVVCAVSPLEGSAEKKTRSCDLVLEAQGRVIVDGFAFDMVTKRTTAWSMS